jgi:nitrate reductase gamma subunit
VNDVLWIGEWVFHVSFVFVVLRHLRYFIDPIPQWIWSIQTPGIIAGYILPVALVYIVAMKVIIEKKKYVSSYNFFLIAMIFTIGVTGLLMKIVFRPDVLGIKEFVLGAVTFRLLNAPESTLFTIHFLMVLIMFICLPTHIFAAPLTLLESGQRNERIKGLVHEK